MKKRVISLALLTVMVLSLTAHAVDARAAYGTPRLTISGTTATCSVTYACDDSDDLLKVTLALWCGDNIVNSWTESGYGEVVIEETCKVVKGNTYDLVMMPVVNGEALEPVTVSANS